MKGPIETVRCPHCGQGFGGQAWSDQINFADVVPTDRKWGYKAIGCPLCHKAIIFLGDYRASQTPVLPAYVVWPKGTQRDPLPAEVPPEFSADYLEACLVLDASPKAAAALGRRCLQHLLRDHVKTKSKDLADQIQEVLDSNALPSDLADNIDAIRVVGNYAAHPMKSTQSGQILDVEPEEAEWTVTVLEELFDFYFVRPAKRAAQRNAVNAKLQAAGKNTTIKKP